MLNRLLRSAKSLVKLSAFSVALTAAVAQPPVGPDPKPEKISPDELLAVIGGPTVVRLSFENARPEEVVRALVQPAGIVLDGYASTDLLKKMPPISVAIADQPFFVALKNVATQLGVSFTLKNPTGFDKPPSGMTLQLQKSEDPQTQISGPMITRGPFVIVATAIERKRSIALELTSAPDRKAPAREEVTVDFAVFADPKVRTRGLQGRPKFADVAPWRIRSAETEAPWDARERNQGPPHLEWRYRATCELPAGAQQARLQTTGSELLVTTKSEPWEIEDVSKAAGTSREVPVAGGTRRYQIEEIALTGGAATSRQSSYNVRLTLSGIGIDKGRWSDWPPIAASAVVDAFRLLDANGRDYAPVSWELKGSAFTATYSNAKGRNGGQPAVAHAAKAIWAVPAEIRSVEMPIEFAALPLP